MRHLALPMLLLAVPAGVIAANSQEKVAVATRTRQPPVIDGDLSDPVWAQTAPIGEFTQQSPDEGEPPSQRTEVRILYDDQAIYFGIHCFDTDPAAIVAQRTRRDRDSFSDDIWLDLDTRGDHRSAWHFEVSAAGVQRDGIRTGDDPDSAIDWEWDATWQSAVGRDSGGWTAEIAIPLAELRYEPAGTVPWRMQIRRFIARRSEMDQWIFVSRLEFGEMLKYGPIAGLSDLPAAHPLLLLPFLVGRVRNRWSPAELQLSRGFDSEMSAGFDARYGITPNLTLNAAVLPDFGQVEVDQVKLNLTTFELTYPEKRPFFQEGADLFTMFNMFGLPTAPQLAYSRRIGAPTPSPFLPAGASLVDSPGVAGARIWGAGKLVGRLGGKLNLAVLEALDAPESATIARADGTHAAEGVSPVTNFFIARTRSTLSETLTGSAMFTSVLRRERGTSLGIEGGCPDGRSRAVDGRCTHDATTAELDLTYTTPDGSWLAFGSLMGSMISGGPPRTLRDGTTIGPGDTGLGWLAQAAKAAGHLFSRLQYLAFSPRLDLNDAGFLRQQNAHSIVFEAGWREFNLGPTRRIYPSIILTGTNSWEGVRRERVYDLQMQTDWQNVWYTELHLKRFPTVFDDRETTDGARTEKADGWGTDWIWRTDRTHTFYSEFTGSARTTWRGYGLSCAESAVFRPSAGFEFSLAPTLDRVTGDPRWVKSSHNCQGQSGLNPDGSKTYCFGLQDAIALGLTLRTILTFTPTMTLQTYGQLFFSSVRYGQLFETSKFGAKPYIHLGDLGPGMGNPSDFETRDSILNLNVVFRWEYLPGSFLYLVYTRSHAGGLAPPQLDPTGQQIRPPLLDFAALGRGSIEDVFLVKLSYYFAR
jgi:hypothetical protein